MNDYIIVNGELTHFGVPGMKWGHRKKYTTTHELNKRRARYEDAREQYEYASRKDKNYAEIKRQYKKAQKVYKKELKKKNENYGDTQQQIDKLLGGSYTSKRVNEYLNRGETMSSARTKAYVETGVAKVKKILIQRKIRKAVDQFSSLTRKSQGQQ